MLPVVTPSTVLECDRLRHWNYLMQPPVDARMGKEPTYSDPSDVTAEDGSVHVIGPDHVDVARTPEAAEDTFDRLLNGAMKATGQRRISQLDHIPK